MRSPFERSLLRFLAASVFFCLTGTGRIALAEEIIPLSTYDSEGYSLTFEASGHFHYMKGDRLMVDGAYTYNGDEITLSDQSGIDACKGSGREAGRYRWALKGQLLTFTKIADNCSDRIRGLTNQNWKMRPKPALKSNGTEGPVYVSRGAA